MSAPDYYELHLLGLAYAACLAHDLALEVGTDLNEEPGAPVVYVGTLNEDRDRNGWSRPTLEDALQRLLDDMGVEYPERPEVEDVEDAEELLDADLPFSSEWQEAFAREPLTVLALLAGER